MSPHDTSFITSLSQGGSLSSIQRELVDLQKLLPETEAGQCLREALDHLLEEQKGIARLLEGNQNLQRNEELRTQYEANLERNSVDLSPNQESRDTFGSAYRKTFWVVMIPNQLSSAPSLCS